MIDSRRLCLDLHINSRPVVKFEGEKTYISTGDSDDMENADTVTFHNRPSRANVAPIKNDVIFAKMANTDKTFLIDEDLATNIYSTGFFDVSSTRILPKFLYYLIQSDEFDSYKNAYSEGTTQISISDKRLKKIKITYETEKAKQRQIVDYLDKKVGIIDKMIANINQQIEDLKQYKRSLITEIVTKGLNKNVSMKDSDLEMIGKIPETWETTKLKYHSKYITDGTHVTPEYIDNGVPFLSIKDISSGVIDFSDVRYISKKQHNELYQHAPVKTGDIIFTRIGTLGISIVVDTDIVFDIFVSIGLIKPKIDINPYFLTYFMNSEYYFQYIQLVKAGGETAAAKFNLFDVKNSPIICPPQVEQQQIVEYLDKKCKKIDTLLQVKQQKVAELTKYKKSLIYECVTGKKEVL